METQSIKRRQWFSASQLKWIAVLTMLVDHSALIFHVRGELYLLMRIIGRIAFPIYCFLLVEGFYHTRDRKKYILRMGIFALITEPVYDFVFEGVIFETGGQNVLLTFTLGLAMLMLADFLKARANPVGRAAALIGAAALAYVLQLEYSMAGIVIIYAFYEFRERRLLKFILAEAVMYFSYGGIQLFGALAFPFLWFYNGEKGQKGGKYFFYFFYPGHLLVLLIIYYITL